MILNLSKTNEPWLPDLLNAFPFTGKFKTVKLRLSTKYGDLLYIQDRNEALAIAQQVPALRQRIMEML